jgi:hypothetical protein
MTHTLHVTILCLKSASNFDSLAKQDFQKSIFSYVLGEVIGTNLICAIVLATIVREVL